jgi:hypothetical protein
VRAQDVWHESSVVPQLDKHDSLVLALLVEVAAPLGGVPGITHDDWQLAAWELQLFMQFVTVEVCASRIFPAATAFVA